MVTAKEIQPGESGKIEVTVNTAGHQGKMSKSVSVISDDPDEGRLRLTVEGKVQALVGFGTRRVEFGHVLPGKRVTRVIPIESSVDKLAPKKVTLTNSKAFEAKLVKSEGKPAVEVTLVAPDTPGRLMAQLELETGVAKQPQARVALIAQVSQNIVVEPLQVVFAGPIRPDQEVSLVVRSLDETPFKIVEVTDNLGVVGWQIEPRREGGWLLLLKLSDAEKAAGKRGTLHLKLDSEKVPSLDVRYTVRAKPGRRMGRPPRQGVH